MGEQTIHVLDQQLTNKIAAGEVVENPGSLVKELLENSIDAGATEITIELKEGGKSLIKIVDNGIGMNSEDAKLSIKRYATSKISSESDLFAITTLGFRGEALASIASVSRFTLITKTDQDVAGTKVNVNDEVIETQEVGSEKGTTIIVEDLFYNVPARKKFLRSMNAELASISDIVERYALSYHTISFLLIHEHKTVLQTTATDDPLNTVTSIYGAVTAKNMLSLNHKDVGVTIKGFIGKPSLSRHDKGRQTLFINGRYVKSKEISDAIKEGYHSMLFLEKEPVYLLHITLDEKQLDVNVHPRKEIVKITHIKDVQIIVSEAVKQRLEEENLIVDVPLQSTKAKPTHNYPFSTDTQATLEVEHDSDSVKPAGTVYDNVKDSLGSLQKQEVKTSAIGPFRILGQINRTYIAAENEEGLLIVDQHAAEERVNYEKLMEQLQKTGIRKQELLEPIIVETSSTEYQIIMDYKTELNNAGFDIEDLGMGSIMVRTVPFIFERPSKLIIQDLISEMKEISSKKLDEKVEDRIIRFSCRKSIKAGDILSVAEIERLIRELDSCSMPFTCPHGRPTIVRVTVAELERKFKRTG